MGTNSRSTRSGQNSGIGKRITRGRGIGSNPASTSSPLASPASTTSSSRPGSAHKKPASTATIATVASSRRGGSGSRKSVTHRPSPVSSRRPPPQPQAEDQDEEIVAEIVVKTEDSEDQIDMDDEPSATLRSPRASTEYDVEPLQSPRRTNSVESTATAKNTVLIQSESADTEVVGEQTLEPGLAAADNVFEALTTVDQTRTKSCQPQMDSKATTPKEQTPSEPEPMELDSTTADSSVPDPPEKSSAQADPADPESVKPSEPEDITAFDESSKFEQAIDMEFNVLEPTEPLLSLSSVPTEQGFHYTGHLALDIKNSEPKAEAIVADSTGPHSMDADVEELRAFDPTTTSLQKVQRLPSPPLTSSNPFIKDIPSLTGKSISEALETSAPLDPLPADLSRKDSKSPDVMHKDEKPAEIDALHLGNKSSISKSEPDGERPDRNSELEPVPSDAGLKGLISNQGIIPAKTESASEVTNGALVDDTSDSELSSLASDISHIDPIPMKSAISHLIGETRNSFASSASAHTERSGLSSKPPSVSSKATTPLDTGSPREVAYYPAPTPAIKHRFTPRIQFDVRPKVSVPADMTLQEYAMECIEAAEHSRLNPYALHQEEYRMLRSHISHAQVTTYLNIRNGILRLWVRNPQIAVTREEAIGCAKDTRWFDVANVCFDWLVRRGLINYGCVEIRHSKNLGNKDSQSQRKTVAVIGAGFAGLGCARQLEGLFLQYAKRFRDMGEEPPRVLVIEARSRVGGRVYSRAFHTLPDTAPGIFRGKRFTAEMGGMIITGFDRGNPLNILVRGQLGLPYHCLRSDMSLYDTNGTAVDPVRDQMVEHLFNACLDRVSEYKFKGPPSKLVEGNHDLIDEGRDSSAEGHKTIALVEETAAAQPHAQPVSEQNVAPQVNLVPVSTDRISGKVHVEPGTPGSTRAAFKAKSLGWNLKPGVNESKDIDLDASANHPHSNLGSVVDDALMQHKDIIDLSAQDFRLLNWHIANLEYSNATNLNKLSIKGWDIDAGNEWEGKHTMVVGGYQSVARGLSMLPAPLDLKQRSPVKRITYTPESTGPAKIELEDGQQIEADYVVNTIPLGVLKHGNVEFQPPLPPWKNEVIERLGFGVLNKVILVYKEAFWDKDRDIFGMLQTPTNRLSLNQKDYAPRRGRFFQWFNVTNTTGMPCLLALMAGDAGYDTEVTPNDELIAEATEVLRMRYGARVTQPLEAIVTRWESDRFARGSYSNAGINMKAEDYNLMAKPTGNLYFAGEHTIVTHPATVHGAYLSGLRAASEVLDSMLGPIEIPIPLVLPRETSSSLKRKAQEEHKDPTQVRLEAYEMKITEYIYSKIGYYPIKPGKPAGSPYLLFNKDNYEEGRRRCEEGRRAGKGKPSPNEVRTMTSRMWKETAPEVRKPYEDQVEEQKRVHAQAMKDWTEAVAKWDKEALALREKYIKENPSVPSPEELASNVTAGHADLNGSRKAKRVVESCAKDGSDADMG